MQNCCAREVFAWGNNEKGQLGTGESSQPKPTWVEKLRNEVVVQICVVKNSSFALTDKGQVPRWSLSRTCDV